MEKELAIKRCGCDPNCSESAKLIEHHPGFRSVQPDGGKPLLQHLGFALGTANSPKEAGFVLKQVICRSLPMF